MLKISKLTDYATAILLYMSKDAELKTTDSIALSVGLELPTTSKVLKLLTKADLLSSTRGVNGGYSLGKKIENISLFDVIQAIEGKTAITDCSHTDNICNQVSGCNSKSGWQKVNAQIQNILSTMTIARMIELNGIAKPDIKLNIKS